jgi:hypothetical protein
MRERNACNGIGPLPGVPKQRCGKCKSGTWQCEGPELKCLGEFNQAARVSDKPYRRKVSADSFLPDGPPENAADGLTTTSWFTAKPPPNPHLPVSNEVSWYWYGNNEECVVQIQIWDNHRNPDTDLQHNHGFGNVTVQVLNSASRKEPSAFAVFDQAGQMNSSEISVTLTAEGTLVISFLHGALGSAVRVGFGALQNAKQSGVSEIDIFALRASSDAAGAGLTP